MTQEGAQSLPVALVSTIPALDSEAGIIRRARMGDTAAFRQLVETHQDWLFRYLCRMSSSPEAAEDLLQETFLLVWRGFSSFQEGRPFRPWVFRIAANVARSAGRRKRVAVVSLHDKAQPEPADPASLSHNRHARDMAVAINAAVARLSADDRELFHLRFGEGLGPSEIAPLLNKSEAAVSASVYRLKEKIRRAIEDNDKEEPK